MATFSPLPSPPQYGGRPSPQRRLRPASRFVTPVRSRSVMDVDNENVEIRQPNETYAQYDELSVSFYADLPIEVRQALTRVTGLNDSSHIYFGTIDSITGFTLAASTKSCFVWQHTQKVKGVPTCYIFPAPPTYNNIPAFATFVPYGGNREPGLLLLSSEGHIRFWDSIGLGLAGADHYIAHSLDLNNEFVTYFIRAEPQLYVASTDRGRLFRIGLTSAGGKMHLSIHQFTPAGRGFSITGLLPSILGTGHNEPSRSGAYVYSLSLDNYAPLDCQDIWVLMGRRLQKWRASSSGGEDILLDVDAVDVIQKAGEVSSSTQNLELLDLVVESQDKLVVFISSTPWSQDEMVNSTSPRCLYYLVFFSVHGSSIAMTGSRIVPHEIKSNASLHPRIRSLQGRIIVVQFGDAICILARDSEFSDRLELKSNTDQVLGVGVVPSTSSFLVLTKKLIMKVNLDLDQIASFNIGARRAHLATSVMMQAILYGSSPNNPLHFSFPPEVREDSVSNAAEQLSAAVLRSDSQILKASMDFDAEMHGREERLRWHIRFINENGVLNKIPSSTRQKLASDAEKLYSCHWLWQAHDEYMQTNPQASVLITSITAYMNSKHENHADPIRAFFRFHVEDITEILQSISNSVDSLSARHADMALPLLSEANDIVLVVINKALEHRERNLKQYGVSFPMQRPWTSERQVIDLTYDLLQKTVKYIDASRIDQDDPRHQKPISRLPELSAVILGCIRERLDWLGSDPYLEAERNELLQKYLELRPNLMDILCRFGFLEAAFTLAEKDRDFASLVGLSHRGAVYPPESNPHGSRIQQYILAYQEEFVIPLFQWYIQHGELRLLFSNAYDSSKYLDHFFSKNNHPNIAWLWQLQENNEAAGAQLLLTAALATSNLKSQQFKLSLGKLAYLVHPEEVQQNVLDRFDIALDAISVHELLMGQLQCTPDELQSHSSQGSRLSAIIQRTASRLEEQPFFMNMYKELVQRLLGGHVLRDEELIDALTLKDNIECTSNFSTALNLFDETTGIPAARRDSTRRTIWRRIFIQDDWNAVSRALADNPDNREDCMRTTVFFNVLQLRQTSKGLPLQPTLSEEALITPSRAEMASRWPGLSDTQLDAMEQDYNFERDLLGEMDVLSELVPMIFQIVQLEER